MQQFSIGNLVWLDQNGDGLVTPGEPGLAGVQLEIVLASSPASVLATQTTAADGRYSFESLRDALLPGTAYLLLIDGEQAPLVTYRATVTSVAVGVDSDSNAARDTGAPTVKYQLPLTTPSFGVDDSTFDAGFVEPFGLGDYVFHDVNADGGMYSARVSACIRATCVRCARVRARVAFLTRVTVLCFFVTQCKTAATCRWPVSWCGCTPTHC